MRNGGSHGGGARDTRLDRNLETTMQLQSAYHAKPQHSGNATTRSHDRHWEAASSMVAQIGNDTAAAIIPATNEYGSECGRRRGLAEMGISALSA